MPAARNDVDWSAIAVQAAAGATHEELAEHWDLPLGTIKARCTREGWKKQAREIQALKTNTEPVAPTSGRLHPSASERGLTLLATLGNRSKLRAAKLGDNTLRVLQRKAKATDGESLIPLAPVLKTTVDTLDKVHSWSTPAPSLTQVNVNLTGATFNPSSK